ncbi:MAG TPA: periplasmic heavy metal sensor [Pyrinomonadaceae bacterium]|nr:periplasmic heavy metal sensor [Pyrinomonadaceae bacterium]
MTTSPRRGSTRLKILLVLLGVFLLGGVTGASLASFYRLRGGPERHEGRKGGGSREDKIFESLRRDLTLTEQQATEIRAILDQTRNDYRALRAEVRPRYDSVRQNARTRIRALLTPEQQKLFDARAAERDARRNDDEK